LEVVISPHGGIAVKMIDWKDTIAVQSGQKKYQERNAEASAPADAKKRRG
jgi:hypothetical protein